MEPCGPRSGQTAVPTEAALPGKHYVIMYEELENLEENQKSFFLNFGANLCKQKSKYRNFNNLKIIYTKLNKLKKTENTGEVIVSGKKNTITI